MATVGSSDEALTRSSKRSGRRRAAIEAGAGKTAALAARVRQLELENAFLHDRLAPSGDPVDHNCDLPDAGTDLRLPEVCTVSQLLGTCNLARDCIASTMGQSFKMPSEAFKAARSIVSHELLNKFNRLYKATCNLYHT